MSSSLMKPVTHVVDRDLGWKKRLLELSKNAYVEVGVRGDEGGTRDDGMTNVRLAAIHEFGCVVETSKGVIEIPARSFIRSTIDEKLDMYKAMLAKYAKAIFQGRLNIKTALERVGLRAAHDIVNKIDDGIEPPNAPRTIVKKGSSKPLINTSQLKKSVTYKVHG